VTGVIGERLKQEKGRVKQRKIRIYSEASQLLLLFSDAESGNI
jgi:hypothetical protein